MLNCTAVKQDEIEDFCPLAYVFVPLGQSSTCGLRLHRKILEEGEEPAVLDIRGLCLH